MELSEIFERELSRIRKVENLKVSLLQNFDTSKGEGGSELTVFDGDGVPYSDIKIDATRDFEIQLNTLFHEYGHVVFEREQGRDGRDKALQDGRDGHRWKVQNELAAYNMQLSEMMRVTEELDIQLLRNTIEMMRSMYEKHECKVYREAFEILIHEEIWIEANNKIAK